MARFVCTLRPQIVAIVTFTAFGLIPQNAHARADVGGRSPDVGGRSPHSGSPFQVIEFMEAHSEDGVPLVLLDAGRQDGILDGAPFEVFRAAHAGSPGDGARVGDGAPFWVKTGKLKAVDVREHLTVAEVIGDGGRMASRLFPEFAQVMAGDQVVAVRPRIQRRQRLLPEATLLYFDLFDDPGADPRSFGLTQAGKQALRRQAQPFTEARIPLLMVEGYTDPSGSSGANQVESYQRAMTVRQFLIDEMGFDPSRVVAIGYGETELVDKSRTPGSRRANRRIVLNAVAVPGEGS